MSQSLTWNGEAITNKLRRAQIMGVNKTMSLAAQHAKSNHPWQSQTGVLEGSYDIAEYAHEVEGGVEGLWGSKGVVYARMQELGGVIVPRRAKALAIPMPDGSVRFAKSVTIPARPALRPAADATYPKLPANIKDAYAKLSGPSGLPEGVS